MKSGVIASAVLHALVLTWGLWTFASPKPLDVSYAEALPVEIVMSDVFQGVKGEKKAPVGEKPAPKPTSKPQKLPMPAENVGDNEADLDTPPVPEAKPNKVEPTPAPKKAAEPDPVPEEKAAEAPPPPPAEKPEPLTPPKPVETPPVAEEPEPAPDPVEQAIETAEAEPQPTPDPAPTPDPVPAKVPLPKQKPQPPKPAVAEAAKPETPKPDAPKPDAAKTDTSKADKTKADKTRKDKSRDKKVADQTAPTDSDFDSDKIAALLTKEKASGGGARRSADQASLGSTRTTGTTLSRSEIGELQGMIQEQMAKCWSPPTGVADAGSLLISIQIRFDPSGALIGPPTILKGGGSGVQGIASEAAIRAIRRCAPFNLPADKYEGGWDVTTLNFDPSQMY